MADVTIFGFGIMGRVAGRRLADAGHRVRISDPAPSAPDAAAEMGATMLTGTAADGPLSGVALLFLPGPDQVRQVLTGRNGILARARGPMVIVDHSTADPDSARDMAELAQANGHGWIDAPVLGRPGAVGNWALPIGQTEGALDKVRPLLELYAAHIFEVGGPGSGHTIKLLNQMMFGAINAMTAEMMAIAEGLGVPPGKLYEIITASQAGTVSNLFRELGGRIARDNFADPTFSVRLLEKDVRLGLAMARKSGVEPRLGRMVAQMNEAALDAGQGEDDSAIMWKMLAGKAD